MQRVQGPGFSTRPTCPLVCGDHYGDHYRYNRDPSRFFIVIAPASSSGCSVMGLKTAPTCLRRARVKYTRAPGGSMYNLAGKNQRPRASCAHGNASNILLAANSRICLFPSARSSRSESRSRCWPVCVNLLDVDRRVLGPEHPGTLYDGPSRLIPRYQDKHLASVGFSRSTLWNQTIIAANIYHDSVSVWPAP
jgi:hypothetical protein